MRFRLWRWVLWGGSGVFLLLFIAWEALRPVEKKENEPVRFEAERVSQPEIAELPFLLQLPEKGPFVRFALPFSALGQDRAVVLRGLQAETTMFVPVNPGFVPERLELALETTPLLPEGHLTILSRGRVLFQVALSPGAHRLSIPLRDARVGGGALELTFRTAFRGEDFCSAYALYEVRILPQSRVVFGGNARYPHEIASFFPPYLREVIFYLREPLTVDEANAVLWMGAFLARQYPGRTPRLVLRPFEGWDRVEPVGPSARIVVWQEGLGAQLVALPPKKGDTSASGVALVLGDLAEAARMFLADPGIKTAVFPAERTEAVELRSPEELGPTLSLAALGYGPRTVSGMGVMSVYYTFSLADFGSARYPNGVRLRVVHTPVSGERAYLQLFLNDAQFETLRLEGTKADFWVALPRDLLRRDNTLELRFQYSPSEGACSRGALPFSATVDPASVFTLDRGQLLSGFDALPQGFLPRFGVYLEPLDRFKLSLATSLVQALQLTTRTPLYPEVVAEPLDTLPLLAVGGRALAKGLGAPLSSPGFRLKDARGTEWLRVEPGAPYAALQAFVKNGHPVLLLSHTSPDGRLMQSLLQELFAEGGWFGVHGDVALRGRAGPVLTFRLLGTDLRIRPLPEPPASLFARYRAEIYLTLAVVVLLALVWVYPRVVRTLDKRDGTS